MTGMKRLEKKISLLAPAKINAFLEVTGRRSDGYHDLKTLFIPVSLYDKIELDFISDGIKVFCSDDDAPSDENNLAAKAARLFFERTGIESGLEIRIEKNIPVAAGLGGGSSDAAAVLKGLNSYFGTPFGIRELCSMGLGLGADVPFFIHSVPSYAEGVGEILSTVEKLVPYEVLIVNPGIPLSTAEVYKNLNLGLTKCKKENKYPALNQGLCDIKKILCNDLEISAMSLCPVIEEIKSYITGQGADGVLMSGSGPSVFGLFSDADKAKKTADIIKADTKWWACQAEMILGPYGFAA